MERLKIVLLLAICVLCYACSDDNDGKVYPSVITSLLDVQTDADKNVASITSDEGQTYYLPNQTLSTNYADTVLRCLGVYEADSILHEAKVYSLQNVISYTPRIYEDPNGLPHEAVRIISSWRTDRYFNMLIAFLTTGNGSHAFGFSEDSVVVTPEGVNTAYISLLHKRPDNDAMSYSQKVFVSLPTHLYAGKADSIVFNVNTYDGQRVFGIKQYE